MRILAIALIATAAAFCSAEADAARAWSSNVVYFDAAGNVVGQDAIYCNNVHWQGGNLTTPYRLQIRGGCGTIIVCNDGSCYDEENTTVTYTLSGSPSFTDEEACDLIGGQACHDREPDILTGYGFVVNPV